MPLRALHIAVSRVKTWLNSTELILLTPFSERRTSCYTSAVKLISSITAMWRCLYKKNLLTGYRGCQWIWLWCCVSLFCGRCLRCYSALTFPRTRTFSNLIIMSKNYLLTDNRYTYNLCIFLVNDIITDVLVISVYSAVPTQWHTHYYTVK